MILGYLISPISWIAFIIGAVVGSFLNVCILRIPEGTFWKNLRSHCPRCQTLIPFYYNIPILSYLLLRGRAACCKTKISPQYPLVELTTALLFVGLYWHMPFLAVYGDGTFTIHYPDLIRYLHLAFFSCLLLVCSVIDLRLMIIPDVLTLGMIATSPLVVYLHPDLDWRSSLYGIVLGGGSLYLIVWLYWLVRRQVGMGFGDVKLLAGIGGWLGYQAIIPTIFLGSIIGSIFGIGMLIWQRQANLKLAIPFGPFLSIGALIHLLFGDKIEAWLFLVQ